MDTFSFLPELNSLYGLNWKEIQVEPFGSGHIHQTYKVIDHRQTYILQRFNKLVFKKPEIISHNHELLIKYMDNFSLPYEFPLPILSISGFTLSEINEDFFRISPFVDGICLDEVSEPSHAYLAAKAFAELIIAANNLEIDEFKEVIPGFLDLELRFNQLTDAVRQTKIPIEGEVKELIDFYISRKFLVEEYLVLKEKLPLRLTHNDTKINNLIFSNDLKSVEAVIDLDTIMPGYVFNDFGDLVRTVACSQGENSTNWDQIFIDKAKYASLHKAFLDVGKGVFTNEEINSLNFGGKMMTCITGFRFLADFLNGNVYYQIKYPQQNLHRAKNQMILLQSLEKMEL
ncbi:aminoglycoside phosphotransferase family protein [Belliella sp. DSM 107340]|uniref:Aminoglycoside phosphotransferase family protein n=1 Tax=Belliella calami TaxID=2923436 RepID=A0ABS9UQ98_9BACT|nr:aminoglycoside phosphotransferase family protein [Belliella calami]MCH7398804.1 aminoglycoside phosphotransferase family protein [Belliella calami]